MRPRENYEADQKGEARGEETIFEQLAMERPMRPTLEVTAMDDNETRLRDDQTIDRKDGMAYKIEKQFSRA